jgi:phosphatidylglycerophosphatase A
MKTSFLNKIIGTGAGLGYMPWAPGTFGALGGLVSGWAIFQFAGSPNLYLAVLCVVFLLVGVYCSNQLIPEWGEDPSRIVIDEVVGMWISMLFIPKSIILMLFAFGLFRLFDIYKPLYIRKLENIPGGWGIMLDDVAAGIWANVVLQITVLLWKSFCPNLNL